MSENKDYEEKRRDGEENGKENIPLLQEGKEVLLTPALEEEIVGPESFAWCGLGLLTSQWLQKLARPEIYLVIFSLSALAQGTFFSYTTGTLSTVEKRFKLPSAVSGFITTGNDMLQMFLSLHLAFAAGNGHRPRWLGGGMLLAACGTFLLMTPHLIFGAGDFSDLKVENMEATNETSETKKGWSYCGRGTEEEEGTCKDDSSSVGIEQYTVAILQFIGQGMSGLANACFYVVGYSYLDEAVTKDKVPLYFAISGCMRIFGPVSGMLLSGYAVGKWVEMGVEPVIKPTHPRWIGAWWLGYPVIITLLLVASVPMMMMPRMLPGSRERTLTRLRAAAKQGKEKFATYRDSLRPLKRPRFREMLPGLRRLFRNKLFMVILINQTCFWSVLMGYFMFKLKYLEHQFKMPAADANKVMGMAGILASVIGWLGTGSMLSFLKPSSKSIMYITMTISVLMMVAFLSLIGITCERDQVIGLKEVLAVNDPMALSHTNVNDMDLSSCMTNCSCPVHYSPVCADDTHLFFSACHAGCKEQFNVNGSLMFGDCQCTDLLVSAPEEISAGKDPEEVVRSGLCVTGCDNFIYYVVIAVIAQMLVASNRVISNILFFRSVDEKDKDLALGLLNLTLSVTFVINPIIVGALIDYSCILWQRTCDRRGYCYMYDLDMYRWILHGIPGFGLFFTLATEAIILRWHKQIDFFGEKEIEQLQLVQIIRSVRRKKNKKGEEEEKEKEKEDKEGKKESTNYDSNKEV